MFKDMLEASRTLGRHSYQWLRALPAPHVNFEGVGNKSTSGLRGLLVSESMRLFWVPSDNLRADYRFAPSQWAKLIVKYLKLSDFLWPILLRVSQITCLLARASLVSDIPISGFEISLIRSSEPSKNDSRISETSPTDDCMFLIFT